MRVALLSSTVSVLMLLAACGDKVVADSATLTGMSTFETGDLTTGDGDGDLTTGDGDPTTGDGDGDPTTGGGCEVPEACLTFVDCIAALAPSQAEAIAEQYGEGGSCWCGTPAEAQECLQICVEQLEAAVENNPTEPACHESSCSLDELDLSQPYGPIEGGGCPDALGAAQEPIDNPFGVSGGYCAPACEGLSNQCPEHPQTTAPGTCYISIGETNYCALRCYVDPTILGGNQCPCGARCQPQGAPDGEGNMRGLCTFE